MKKLNLFLIALCFVLFGLPCNQNFSYIYKTSFAKAEKSTYAKALAGCTLYKTQSLEEDFSNILFVVPETYFVTILDNVSEECVKVQYDRFVGYAKADKLVIATFTPIVKTLENITIDIKSSAGTQVWSSPSTSGQILSTIPAGFKNIHYIASAFGTIPSGGENNLWYYVCYTPNESTNVYEGYIYSENTTNLSKITANTEVNPEVFEEGILGKNTIYLSSSLKTVIIAIITIPIVMFLAIILYKSTKKFKDFTNKQIKAREEKQPTQTFGFEENNNFYQNKFSSEQSQNKPKISLGEKLAKMKDLKFIKRSNNSQISALPKFPDYDPDDDIL